MRVDGIHNKIFRVESSVQQSTVNKGVVVMKGSAVFMHACLLGANKTSTQRRLSASNTQRAACLLERRQAREFVREEVIWRMKVCTSVHSRFALFINIFDTNKYIRVKFFIFVYSGGSQTIAGRQTLRTTSADRCCDRCVPDESTMKQCGSLSCTGNPKFDHEYPPKATSYNPIVPHPSCVRVVP